MDSYSAFFENDKVTQTGLAGYLREVGCTHLTMVGLATDFCVAWSALDGAARRDLWLRSAWQAAGLLLVSMDRLILR